MNEAVIAGIIGIILIILAVFVVKRLLILFFNTVLGVLALMGWNVLFPNIVINFWSVLLVSLGGIFGFIIVILLHFLRVAF